MPHKCNVTYMSSVNCKLLASTDMNYAIIEVIHNFNSKRRIFGLYHIARLYIHINCFKPAARIYASLRKFFTAVAVLDFKNWEGQCGAN